MFGISNLFSLMIWVIHCFAAAIQQEPCVPPNAIHMIVARATEGPIQGVGIQEILVKEVQKLLPGSTAEGVIYPASFKLPDSVNDGVVNMTRQAEAYTSRCPDSWMALLGYSQGGIIVGETVAGGGCNLPYGGATNATPPLSDNVMQKVAAVVMLGDVCRNAGFDQYSDGCTVDSRWPRSPAALQQLEKYANKVGEFCHSEDPACCGTGLNIIAHINYLFNSTDVHVVARFIAAKLMQATTGIV